MRASLCAVAVVAGGIPSRARMRRKCWPRDDGLRYNDWVAQRSAWAARLVPGPVRELITLPPVIWLCGHRFSQEANCPTVGIRDSSGLSSVNRTSAALSPMPGISVIALAVSARLGETAWVRPATCGGHRARGWWRAGSRPARVGSWPGRVVPKCCGRTWPAAFGDGLRQPRKPPFEQPRAALR